MIYKLVAFSPLHIGTGNPIEPFDYFTGNNTFIRFNQDAAFSLAYDKHPDFADKYSRWLNNTLDKLERERDNQRQSEIRQRFNLVNFFRDELKDTELAGLIQTKAVRYTASLPYGLDKRKQIDELLKDAFNKPYIPGSSIKGAIRTALVANAYSQLDKNEKAAILSNISRILNSSRGRPRNVADAIEHDILYAGFKRGNDNTVQYSDEKYDLMKFIRVSDGISTNAGITVYPMNLYLSNDDPQSQANAQEVITAGSEFTFSLTVDMNTLRTVFNKTKDAGQHFINAEYKFRRLLGLGNGISLDNINETDVVNRIIEIVKSFYGLALNRDKQWSQKSHNNISRNLETVYTKIPADKNIIRIGKGSGFTATTIFNKLDITNPVEKNFIDSLFSIFRIGYSRKKLTEQSAPNLEKFPKSRKISAQKTTTPIAPLGWCILADVNDQISVPAWEPMMVLPDTVAPANVKPKTEKLSAEDYIKNNAGKTINVNDSVEAEFVKAQGKTVFIKILHPDYASVEFQFAYAGWQVLENEKIFLVKVAEVKSKKIVRVNFLKKIE